MNILTKSASLMTAGMLVLAGAANAQLQTFETVTAYEGSTGAFSNTTPARAQLFTNVSAVKSMTYNFFTNASGTALETNLSATFGEWSAGAFVPGSTVSFGTVTIPGSNSGQWTALQTDFGLDEGVFTYAKAFDLTTINAELINSTFGYLTNSSKTYALLLTRLNPTSTGLALGRTDSNAFAYGSSRETVGEDYVFSQIVVAPGNQQLVPVPESSTVAAIGSAVLVAGLVGFRLRQRRAASVAAPVEVAAA